MLAALCANISERRFAELRDVLVRQGYDGTSLRRVPHPWPDAELVAARRRAGVEESH